MDNLYFTAAALHEMINYVISTWEKIVFKQVIFCPLTVAAKMTDGALKKKNPFTTIYVYFLVPYGKFIPGSRYQSEI